MHSLDEVASKRIIRTLKERSEENDFPRKILTINEINSIMSYDEISHMPFGIARDMASSMCKISTKSDLEKIACIMSSLNAKLKVESSEHYGKVVLSKFITVSSGLVDVDDVTDQDLINPIKHLCGYFRQLFLVNIPSCVVLDS